MNITTLQLEYVLGGAQYSARDGTPRLPFRMTAKLTLERSKMSQFIAPCRTWLGQELHVYALVLDLVPADPALQVLAIPQAPHVHLLEVVRASSDRKSSSPNSSPSSPDSYQSLHSYAPWSRSISARAQSVPCRLI